MDTKATMTTKSYFWSALISFLLITSVYFSWLKPMNKYKFHLVADTLGDYNTTNYKYTLIYFIVLFVIQICVGWSVVNATKCDIVQDKGRVLGEVFKSTALPWLFIFGFSLVVVLLKPNFKSVFSNVYGYFIVKATANSILTELLKNEKQVKTVAATAAIGTVAGAATTADPTTIQNTADAILKICGNTGILVNQITPINFIEYMKMLQPLMKDNYGDAVLNFDTTKSTDPDKVFQYTGKLNAKGAVMGGFQDPDNIFYKLFEVVERRDSIGEYAWYIYTALFVIAIVSYNIAMIPCR
jgi:hypothetical protein